MGKGKSYKDKCTRTGNVYTREAKDKEQIITLKNVKYSPADNWLVNVPFEDRAVDCSL